jgi:hypothetical protein
MKKTVIVAIAVMLAVALPPLPCPAQAPLPGTPTPQAAKPPVPKFTITGKIYKDETGYYIQGQKPPEVFTILNPDPQVLDKLAKSGKTVTIEARSEGGDNVAIAKIDGKNYPAGKESKGK